MQQQQPQPPPPVRQMPANITTEQIQKFLDENKQLILAILENQNLGKLSECAQYQAQLQKNLLYLAAIADAQPQVSPIRHQTIPNTATLPPQGSPFVQQTPMYPPRPPIIFNPQVNGELQQLHQHPQVMPFPQHMGVRPGMDNGMHVMQAQASHGEGGESVPSPGLAEFGRDHSTVLSGSTDNMRGSKHDLGTALLESGAAGGGGQRSTGGTELRSGNGDLTPSQRQEDGGKVS